MYSLKMSVGALVTLVVALLAVTELQAAPALPSSAGTIERTLPGQQGITAPPPAAEDIVAPTPVKESARPTNGRKITVSRFIVEGNTKLTEDEIAQLLGAAEGKALTLAEIYELADRLGAAYRDKGYRLATVTVPPQKISDGEIRLEVTEGVLESVQVTQTNHFSETFIREQLDQLEDGEVLSLEAMEREMLLLNDIPGLSARSVIKPGTAYGTSVVEIDAGEKIYDGYLSSNNYGREDVGEWRLEGGVSLNNPLGIGDRLSFDFMHTQADLLNYYAFNYSLPVTKAGTRLAFSYSEAEFEVALDSAIKAAFSGGQLEGVTRSARIQLSHPLVRSRDRNILLGVGLLHKDANSEDEASLTQPHAFDREDTINLLDLSVVMSQVHADRSISNVAAVFWTNFRKRRNDPFAVDDAGAPASGGDRNRLRGKLRIDANHLRSFYWDSSLFLRAAGVLAVDALPESEKFGIGGPADVRGFPTSEVRGDQGYSLTAELRRPFKDVLGQDLLARAFFDVGKVYRKDRLPLVERTQSLSSLGFGVSLSPFKRLQVDLNMAFPTNGHKASDGSHSSRYWASLSTQF